MQSAIQTKQHTTRSTVYKTDHRREITNTALNKEFYRKQIMKASD